MRLSFLRCTELLPLTTSAGRRKLKAPTKEVLPLVQTRIYAVRMHRQVSCRQLTMSQNIAVWQEAIPVSTLVGQNMA